MSALLGETFEGEPIIARCEEAGITTDGEYAFDSDQVARATDDLLVRRQQCGTIGLQLWIRLCLQLQHNPLR